MFVPPVPGPAGPRPQRGLRTTPWPAGQASQPSAAGRSSRRGSTTARLIVFRYISGSSRPLPEALWAPDVGGRANRTHGDDYLVDRMAVEVPEDRWVGQPALPGRLSAGSAGARCELSVEIKLASIVARRRGFHSRRPEFSQRLRSYWRQVEISRAAGGAGRRQPSPQARAAPPGRPRMPPRGTSRRTCASRWVVQPCLQ